MKHNASFPGIMVLTLLGGSCVTGTIDSADQAPPCPGPDCGQTLAWMAPTTNADGSPLGDLAGYEIHYDSIGRGSDTSHVYANAVDIGMPACHATASGTECEYDLASLAIANGTNVYVAVTAYDAAYPPNESPYSNEIAVTR
jgi:hypothetical protein